MLIGELSRSTGVTTRLLRYYEEQELLVPQRDSNGYRRYDDQAPERVRRIRTLLDTGLPTRSIRELLPCATDAGIQSCDRTRSVLDANLTRLDRQISELTRRRAALIELPLA
ncbi:MerR family transcriptional regulator [Nocardia sp. NPDC127579]|uniref:MerR family transcriptional regulator n=1 Tax=Nocardia sp. NPDC127579 TaxID=3345402 RepID=UPI00363530D6